jgi:hypothetical protein
MTTATVLIGLILVYVAITILLGSIDGNYFEGFFVASLLMIITIAALTFYDHARKNQTSPTSPVATTVAPEVNSASSEAPKNQ